MDLSASTGDAVLGEECCTGRRSVKLEGTGACRTLQWECLHSAGYELARSVRTNNSTRGDKSEKGREEGR